MDQPTPAPAVSGTTTSPATESSASAPPKSSDPPLSNSTSDGWRSKRVLPPLWRRRRLLAGRLMARKRAHQRWSALVGAPRSRIARQMRSVLSDAEWKTFLARAASHKAAFVRAFEPPDGDPVLRCAGTRDGSPCPHSFAVDLREEDAGQKLAELHVDHEYDVQVTCDRWRRRPGTCVDELCRRLVDVGHTRFRCGPPRDGSGRAYCHDLHLPHDTM